MWFRRGGTTCMYFSRIIMNHYFWILQFKGTQAHCECWATTDKWFWDPTHTYSVVVGLCEHMRLSKIHEFLEFLNPPCKKELVTRKQWKYKTRYEFWMMTDCRLILRSAIFVQLNLQPQAQHVKTGSQLWHCMAVRASWVLWMSLEKVFFTSQIQLLMSNFGPIWLVEHCLTLVM